MVTAVRRSGHARLKAALVLRDALATELGMPLAAAMAQLRTVENKGEAVSEFTLADLQLAAFWMATAAGKTHVLHACLALLEKRRPWDRITVITPSESLTRQHADKLRELAAWEVFAYPMDGDASAMGRLPPDAVIVLDINKLAIEKKGDGVTVPTSVFADGRNLVFVDEGHKGQKPEASVWKALQADMAGIDAPMPAHQGLLIEFSATFGQVAEGEHASVTKHFHSCSHPARRIETRRMRGSCRHSAAP